MTYNQKLGILLHDIKYELAEGIHTYHQCGCGKRATRRGECAYCLLDKFYKERNDVDLDEAE